MGKLKFTDCSDVQQMFSSGAITNFRQRMKIATPSHKDLLGLYKSMKLDKALNKIST